MQGDVCKDKHQHSCEHADVAVGSSPSPAAHTSTQWHAHALPGGVLELGSGIAGSLLSRGGRSPPVSSYGAWGAITQCRRGTNARQSNVDALERTALSVRLRVALLNGSASTQASVDAATWWLAKPGGGCCLSVLALSFRQKWPQDSIALFCSSCAGSTKAKEPGVLH